MTSTRRSLAALLAVAVGVLAVDSALAVPLVVRASGPSAALYRPGQRLAENSVVMLASGDRLTVLDARGTRNLTGPGSFRLDPNSVATPPWLGGILDVNADRRTAIGGVHGSLAPSTQTAVAVGSTSRQVRTGAVRSGGSERDALERAAAAARSSADRSASVARESTKRSAAATEAAAARDAAERLAGSGSARVAKRDQTTRPGSLESGQIGGDRFASELYPAVETAPAGRLVERGGESGEIERPSFTRPVAPPSPWPIDIATGGTMCVPASGPILLWRADAASPATVSIAKAGGPPLTIAFSMAQAMAALPSGFAVTDGEILTIGVGPAAIAVTVRRVRTVPPALDAVAAALIDRGCLAQFDRLATLTLVADAPVP